MQVFKRPLKGLGIAMISKLFFMLQTTYKKDIYTTKI